MNRLRLRTTLLACALTALVAPSAASADGCPGETVMPSSGNVQQVREATLCLLNQQRAAHNLPAFGYNGTLEATAQPTAADMVARRYFSHTPPEGTSLQDKLGAFIAGTSHWFIGENLAWGEGAAATPANTMVAWMNSPGHRANILNGQFAEVGVGVVSGTPGGSVNGATYANHFGTRSMGGGGGDQGGETADTRPTSRTRRVKSCKRVKLKGKAARVAKRNNRKSTKRVCFSRTVRR